MIKHKYKQIYLELKSGVSVGETKTRHGLSPDQWYRASNAIYSEFLKEQKASINKLFPGQDSSDNLGIINDNLARYALAFPGYGTHGEVESIVGKVKNNPIDIDSITDEIFNIVMNPTMRAVVTEAYFSEPQIGNVKNIFHEFNYIIDSSLLAFYRGNVVASLISIIPVIEGILLRWQGFPTTIMKKPSFDETIKFLKNSKVRQPMPKSVQIFDPWLKAVINILENHLFKDTSNINGTHSFDYFNRHIAMHLLTDKPFCTPMNIMRTFLLIDILFELFLCENQIGNFQFTAKYGTTNINRTKTFHAYNEAYNSYTSMQTPENNLSRHSQIQKL